MAEPSVAVENRTPFMRDGESPDSMSQRVFFPSVEASDGSCPPLKSREEANTETMGLSSFPAAAEGLLPLLAMKTALSVSRVKSTWRSVLQAIAGGSAAEAEAEARDSAPRDDEEEAAPRRRRRVRVKRLEMACPETWGASGSECGCSCCVCLCRFEAEEEVSELSCRHFFHRGCLERWFENDHRTCPLCRSVL